MRICIVSPHLDDAVLSCGILMQRHKALSDDVFVLNIFSAGTNGENRKKEDRCATETLGAVAFYLEELDAPDRDPLYRSDVQLFFGTLAPDAPIIAKVSGLVQDFLTRQGIDQAIFPLAAGNHIDHRIAFEAGRRITGTKVGFYEDRPYILWPGVLQGRMNQIGSDAVLPEVTERMMLDALDDYHHLHHFVPKGAYQETCLPLYFAALNHSSSGTLKARSATLVATEAELQKLYDSLQCYESQMPLIYPDYERFIRDSFAYEQGNSGRNVYAERSWEFES